MQETVIGLFNQSQQAQTIVPLLLSNGFGQKDIDLIGSQDDGAGANVTDALSRLGLPDQQQRECYRDGVSRGGTLIAAHAADERQAIKAATLMREHGAVNCTTSAGTADATGRAQERHGEGAARIPVVEEQLHVGKREVETGGVRVRQEVSERPVEAQVNLREEHVSVDRRPADRPLTEGERDAALSGKTLEVTESSEKPVVQKTARVVEEVVVKKDVDQHTETVSDKVRRTDVDVEKVPGQKRKGN